MVTSRSNLRHSTAVRLASALLLLAHGPGFAAVFTVGPAGDYATIHAGVAAALPVAGSSNEVRVQSGTFSERPTWTQSNGTLRISGGWNAQFTVRSANPAATTINANTNGRVLDVSVTGGTLELSHFLIVAGNVSGNGAGLRLRAENDAFARVHDTHLLLNASQVVGSPYAMGGAVELTVLQQAAVQFDHNLIAGNAAIAEQAGYGAGLFAFADGSSNTLIQHNTFSDNVVTATAPNFTLSSGAGMWIAQRSGARVSVTDNVFEGNRLDVPPGAGQASGTAVLTNCSTCELDLHRNRWSANLGGQNQVDIDVSELSGVDVHAILANSVIEGGNVRGLRAVSSLASGQLDLVNLTVTGHSERGITATGTVTMSNTIAFGNGNDDAVLGNEVLTQTNLVGVDPHFVDATGGNFRLRDTSPARDAGFATPPGGVGLFDLDNAARVIGASVDIGAYEFDPYVFGDGFE